MKKKRRAAAKPAPRVTARAPEPRARPDGRLALLAASVAVLAIAAYANAFGNDFALDDIRAIVENPVIRNLGNVGRIFRTNYWDTGVPGVTALDPGLYRPLTVLTYMLDYRAWGLNAIAWHAVNVVLHAASTLLVFTLAVDVVGSRAAAFVAAAIFAVHPIHTDAVASVVGRAEILATLFFLLAFWVARRARHAAAHSGSTARGPASSAIVSGVLTGALYLLGLFAKETAVTLPAVVLLDDWLHRSEFPADRGATVRMVVARYAPLGIVLLAYLALRSQALTGHGAWLGFTGVSAVHRLLTASRVLLEYLALFVFPRVLLADYWKTDVPIAQSVLEPLVLASVVAWVALAALAATKLRRDRTFLLSTAWFFVTVLPVSNIFFPIGVAKAERILYLPSVGLCFVVGWAYARVSRMTRHAWVPAATLAAVLLALAVRTYRRNADWKDSLTLALATLKVSPRSPLMNDIAGRELAKRGDVEQATRFSEAAVRETPEVALVHAHLAAQYFARGLLNPARAEYDRVVALDPNNAEAHSNLGLIYLNTQQQDAAIREFKAAQRANPNSAEPHINLGVIYSDRGQLAEAEGEFFAALRSNSNSAEAHLNLGTVYLTAKRLDDAVGQFEAALGLNPKSPQAHNNLGYAYLQKGLVAQAISEFRAALALKPDYANARGNLDRALRQQANPGGAR